MSSQLSVTDWKQYRDTRSNVSPQVRPWEFVDLPPLPTGLDDNDPYAVKLYIIQLMRACAEAFLPRTFWEIRNRDAQTEVRCGLNGIKLPDGYQVQGLDEAEIRKIAGNRSFDPPSYESLFGNNDPSE
jgi:hypothetical protein